ncbi:putative small proline-rich protein 5 [Cuculus canorus]|uniref:putative small proline-rich protein 5 n=1 Tax=Cuculus canorus TaxID=55661 RepID=UPI0023AAE793|nr:putative small proline-rich protein 5 [Cuculus canorus]
MSQITLRKSIKGLSAWFPSLASRLLYSFIPVAEGLCQYSRKMCSRRSCHSHETSCHEPHSSCHDSGSSCHYTIQRQPVQKFSYVTPCCPPVQPYCPPVQPYCPPVQRYCPQTPYCPQYPKNICKLPPTYPKY